MILLDGTLGSFQYAGVTQSGAGGLPPVFTPAHIEAGSTGADFSTNMPAFPVVGANWPTTGSLYENYVLLTTIPANPARANAEIHNLSGVNLVVIRDDGTAQTGNVMTNASLFMIPPGAGQGQPGAPYANKTFKGRYQVYGPAGAGPITALVD